MTVDDGAPLTLTGIGRSFEGLVPIVVCTASSAGVPNVTYLSRVHRVDDERIALSNQFLSKSAQNLAENPVASLLVVDSFSFEQYRLEIAFERTERRGPVFDQLRRDIAVIAALNGMCDVFRLRGADIYRVISIERIVSNDLLPVPVEEDRFEHGAGALGELCARLSRSSDLDSLVRIAVSGLAELLGYEHSVLLLVDEDRTQLFTLASHGYADEGIGSEVPVGEGLVGVAAEQCVPVRVGNLRQVNKYARRVRRSFEEQGVVAPGREVPLPALEEAQSAVAVPVMSRGQLVGALVAEDLREAWYGEADVGTLTVIASLLGGAIETIRAEALLAATAPSAASAPAPAGATPPPSASTHVRFFPIDGSTFLDGEYLIKGVAGRIFWSLLRQHGTEGRVDFTNREVRLDPTLDLPDFRDNFESRLILLKRRLDERSAPIRIDKTGRGRFRLVVETVPRLEEMGEI